MQRARAADSIQGFMTSFKQFEKKLDKLHDDVRFHGNTLSELRVLVSNLAVAMNSDKNPDSAKRALKRNSAVQYEHRTRIDDKSKFKPKQVPSPITGKTKTKSFEDQKYGLRKESPFKIKKMISPTTRKHANRPSKADAPRKATTLKKLEKNRNKAVK